MAKHESLIARLCEASEGSKELSRQFWVAMGAVMPATSPCLTTSLSAAWEEAERRDLYFGITKYQAVGGPIYQVNAERLGEEPQIMQRGNTPALALCAAILAAEGER